MSVSYLVPAGVPWVNQDGTPTRDFFRLVRSLWQDASGGGSYSRTLTQLTPDASPWAYLAPSPGALLLSGGGITSLVVNRAGIAAPVGLFYAPLPLGTGDQVVVSYAFTPTAWFLPT